MLIKMNDNGLCVDNNEVVLVSSRYVAQVFGKRHSHVINDVKSLKSRLKTLVNKGSLEKNSQPKIRLVKCLKRTAENSALLLHF